MNECAREVLFKWKTGKKMAKVRIGLFPGDVHDSDSMDGGDLGSESWWQLIIGLRAPTRTFYRRLGKRIRTHVLSRGVWTMGRWDRCEKNVSHTGSL